jgi:hypothetical protein
VVKFHQRDVVATSFELGHWVVMETLGGVDGSFTDVLVATI